MDWQAKWIWARSRVDTPNFYLYARKEIELDAAAQAAAFVTCSSQYKLYVNGRYVGRGPSPCRPEFQYYDEYDLTRILRAGKNCVAAICYNHGVDTGLRPRTPGGFLLQIDLARNGETFTFATDDTWKVRPADDWDFNSARLPGAAGFAEVYDCGRKPVGWNVVGFDDSGWEDAFVIDMGARGSCRAGSDGASRSREGVVLVRRDTPPLREWEVFPERVVRSSDGASRSREGVVLVRRDIPPLREWEVFPERVVRSEAVRKPEGVLNTTGGAAVVSPGKAARMTLDFGREVVGFPVLRVTDSGHAVVDIGYSQSLDADGGMPHADRFILSGGRRELQTFGRRAFRYVQLALHDLDSSVHVESVSVARIGYPVEQVSTFECSDGPLSDIWRAGVHSLSLRMQDSYEGDARVQALANYYSFFDTRLAAKTLRESARLRDREPVWLIMLHDYYLYTGDKSLVEELYPRLRLVIDELPADDLLLHQALRDAAKLASAVGEIEDAITWHDRAGQALDSSADPAAQSRMGVFYALQAMLRLGRVEECLGMVREASCDPVACVAAVYFLSADVLGVKPSLPESDVVSIQPRVGDLEWARGTIKTQRSCVEVEWRSQPGRFTIDISAPEGFIVGLPVGAFRSPRIDEIDLSPETPERRARRAYGWGSIIWRDGEERDPYLDWLRTQEAEPPEDYLSRKRCEVEGGYVWVRESLLTHVRYEVSEAQ